jgi:protein-L-isoaspartate O-methyltransferase
MQSFMEQLATNPEIPLSRTCERALRMLPRGMYHSEVPAEDAYSDVELSVLPGHTTEPASVDVLIVQKLRLAPGQRFLEIGSGSGYLTALAAYMVGANGSATGVDISSAAVEYAREQCSAMHKAGRFGHGVAAPRFLLRDGGTLLEVGELWDAVVVSGNVPPPWIKTLIKLCSENGRLIACVDEQLCLFEHGSSAKDGQFIGFYKYPDMTLSRRRKLQQVVPQGARKPDSKVEGSQPRGAARQRPPTGSMVPSAGAAAAAASASLAEAPARDAEAPAAEQRGSAVDVDQASSEGNISEVGLQPRLPGASGLIPPSESKENGKGGEITEDAQMQHLKQEIEIEQMNGLLVRADDVEICRTPKGRKCRLGEGGFGVVYKALMNGVDEVAIKLVKV